MGHPRKQPSTGVVADIVFYTNAVQSTCFLDINAQLVQFI